MKPDEAQVRSVVRSVWATQFGLEIEDAEGAAAPPEQATITAAIHISGDSAGGVRIECSRKLIRRVASIMFGQPEENLTEDDDRDVIGEMTNVVAGNIKALIPGLNSISLPTIIEGSDYRISSVDVKSMEHVAFTLDGEVLVVTVLEHGG